MIPSDRLAEVYRVFALAIEADPPARRAVVEAHTGAQPDLAAEILALLDAHDTSDGFLPAPAAPGPVPDGAPRRPGPDDVVGAWRLVAPIGEGGMGRVFRAERADGVFRQQVAIKITRLSLIDRDASRRFRAERAILAGLHHTHIVTLLDGGTLPTGEAWLAMELVDGEPITRWVQTRALDLTARLRLFRDVCAAVHHAHQHGIVHRDLKPPNVLVTADGVVKVVDFGVAKLLDPGAAADATQTGGIPAPLTPNYASPEQLRGLPVTTATDVYALGVLLYEIVCGAKPYETAQKPLDEVLAIVVDREPRRPSEVVAASGGSVWPRRGDLDAIVLKAMAKTPERRYASAAELADEVRRYLDGRPVLAEEPSFWYVASRTLRRHALASAAAAVAMVAIIAGLGVSLWQARIAERERQRAEARLADVRRLANTMVFTVHDEVEKLTGSTPVRQLIVREALDYLERLAREPGNDPGVRLELAETYVRIGRVQGDPQQRNLGDREGARRSFQQALELVTPLTTHPEAKTRAAALNLAARAQMLLTNVFSVLGQRDAALESARASVALSERSAAEAPGDEAGERRLANAHFALALALQTGPEAVDQWRKAGRAFEALLAVRPEDPDRLRNVALVCKYLGGALGNLGQDEEARTQLERALEIDERRLALAPNDLGVQFDVSNDLVSLAGSFHPHPRGEVLLQRALAMRERLAAADPKDVLMLGKLGSVQWRLGSYALFSGRPQDARVWAERAVATMGRAAERQSDLVTLRDLAASQAVLALAIHRSGDRQAGCAAAHRAAGTVQRIKQLNGETIWEVLDELPVLVAACQSR